MAFGNLIGQKISIKLFPSPETDGSPSDNVNKFFLIHTMRHSSRNAFTLINLVSLFTQSDTFYCRYFSQFFMKLSDENKMEDQGIVLHVFIINISSSIFMASALAPLKKDMFLRYHILRLESAITGISHTLTVFIYFIREQF